MRSYHLVKFWQVCFLCAYIYVKSKNVLVKLANGHCHVGLVMSGLEIFWLKNRKAQSQLENSLRIQGTRPWICYSTGFECNAQYISKSLLELWRKYLQVTFWKVFLIPRSVPSRWSSVCLTLKAGYSTRYLGITLYYGFMQINSECDLWLGLGHLYWLSLHWNLESTWCSWIAV